MDNLLALRMFAVTGDAVAPHVAPDEDSSGPLRLSVPAVFGRRIISTQLGPFMARNPGLGLDISLTEAFIDMFAPRVAPRIRPRLLDGVVNETVNSSRQKIVASPAYLQSYGSPATPTDLGKHYCLRSNYGTTQKTWSFQEGDMVTQVAVSGRIKSNNSEVLRELALAGIGIARLPDWMVNQDIAGGLLTSLFPNHVVCPDNPHTTAPSFAEAVSSGQADAFISFVTAALDPRA